MKHTLKLTIFLVLLLLPSAAFGVDYTVSTSTTTVDGDTFCGGSACTSSDTIIIDGGARGDLLFRDFDGSGSYITITNEDTNPDSKVEITSNGAGGWGILSLSNCKYVDLRGNNDGDLAYGIKVINDGTPSRSGTVWVYGESDHIKLGYLEIAFEGSPTGSGLLVHCSELSSAWIFDTFEIHHNYIHDTEYAGMYLGHNWPGADDNPYAGTFSIHDNIMEDLGSYGITYKGINGPNNYIYNNVIKTTGLVPGSMSDNFFHGIGVQMFSGSYYAEVYNNWIEKTVGPGLKLSHANHLIYNNVIAGCGTGNDATWGHGIVTDGSQTVTVTAYQNTIVEATRYGIYGKSTTTTINHRDNIITECGLGEAGGSGLSEGSGAGANTYDVNASNMYFTTWSDDGDYSNDDFLLTETSPAKNAGQSTGYPSTDYVGTVRPQESVADDGAYEYIPSGEPPPSSDWSRKCELVIQHGQVPGDVTNLPVVLTADTLPEEMIDSDHADYAANKAQADGGDLRFFTDSAGTNRIACDLEDFTHGSTPTVEIWTLVPVAYGAVNTSIWVTYNATGKSQPAADAPYGSETVWAGHRAVWHLNETHSTATDHYKDATANDNHGQLTDADSDSVQGTGQIGKCIDFNGDADWINAGNDASLEMGLNDWSIETWFKGAAGHNRFMEKGGIPNSSEGYNFWYYGTDDSLRAYLVEEGLTNKFVHSDTTLNADDGSFHHIVVTHDRDGNATFYLDGSAVGTYDISAFSTEDITNSGQDFKLGTVGEDYSVTSIDEIRVCATLLSSDQITAEYNNQNSPATFVIEGTPENVTTTDTTRPTITDQGWWDAETNTCVTNKSITYTTSGDVIPLCLICDEELSVEVPGISSVPNLTVKPGPLTSDTGIAIYAGYDNSGATTIIKLNYTVSTGERSTDFQANATSSFSLDMGSSIAIVTITKANPGVVTTTASHGLSTDDYVYFNQLGEMTEIEDNCYQITVIDSTSFSIIDTSGFTSAEADGGSEECFKADSFMVDPYYNMLIATLPDTDFGSIVIAVPKDWIQIDYATYMLLATATYCAPDDSYTYAADTTETDFNADGAGSSGHPVVINGGGYAITYTNGAVFDEDYYTLNRIKYGSEITIAGNNVTANYGLLTSDWLKTMTGIGIVVNNHTIVGTAVLDIDVNTAINNCIVKDCALANGITLTPCNTLFYESEATIEGDGGTVDNTGAATCTFSVDPLFRDETNGNYLLQYVSPGYNGGKDVSLTEDIKGSAIVGSPDIGAYEIYRRRRLR